MESSASAPAGAGQAITVRLNVHDALFASGRQPSDAPTAGSMTESISRATAAWPAPQLAAREATTQPADAAEMNETCDRRGELDLGRHCTSRLRAALCAQGRTIWPVVRARRALQARHGLPLRCPANLPRRQPFDGRRNVIR
jgi:hypothetical protein